MYGSTSCFTEQGTPDLGKRQARENHSRAGSQRGPCLTDDVSEPEVPLVLCPFPHLSTAGWRIPPGKDTSLLTVQAEPSHHPPSLSHTQSLPKGTILNQAEKANSAFISFTECQVKFS